jgi:hypothetical protein
MLRLLTLAAFLLTGPGLSGLEIAAHLTGNGSGGDGTEHARAPHFEVAGTWSHAEHCGLGLAAHDGRLPARPSVRRVAMAPVRSELHPPSVLSFSNSSPFLAFPRAPPAVV